MESQCRRAFELSRQSKAESVWKVPRRAAANNKLQCVVEDCIEFRSLSDESSGWSAIPGIVTELEIISRILEKAIQIATPTGTRRAKGSVLRRPGTLAAGCGSGPASVLSTLPPRSSPLPKGVRTGSNRHLRLHRPTCRNHYTTNTMHSRTRNRTRCPKIEQGPVRAGA